MRGKSARLKRRRSHGGSISLVTTNREKSAEVIVTGKVKKIGSR